jgi:hypothetical protein
MVRLLSERFLKLSLPAAERLLILARLFKALSLPKLSRKSLGNDKFSKPGQAHVVAAATVKTVVAFISQRP